MHVILIQILETTSTGTRRVEVGGKSVFRFVNLKYLDTSLPSEIFANFILLQTKEATDVIRRVAFTVTADKNHIHSRYHINAMLCDVY